MSFSRREFNQAFGQAVFPNRRCEELLVFVESAGNPTGSINPAFIGQECFDTANARFYKAVGLTNADWRSITA